MRERGLHASAIERFESDARSTTSRKEKLPSLEGSFHFGMQCNGYFQLPNGEWQYNAESVEPFRKEFRGQRVSFFGPTFADSFYQGNELPAEPILSSLNQVQFMEVIQKYRDVDEDLAARIAYVLGGMARHFYTERESSWENGKEDIGFVADKTKLADAKSADATVSALAMYAISDGPITQSREFTGNIYHMANAVSEDDITAESTYSLGMSQTNRLHTFLTKKRICSPKEPLDSTTEGFPFKKFPTVGAEFHFTPDIVNESPDFLQRLAILNMSQYQRGSYIQLCRNDRDVYEIRMNPSAYPVTVANWNHMKIILPELNEAFFTITFNREDMNGDFDWKNKDDADLLHKLKALSGLLYAGQLKTVPKTVNKGEFNLGNSYLGQTIRAENGQFHFTGFWNGDRGRDGQIGLYAGFGNNFPYLAYYPSMVLAEPDILEENGGTDFLRSIHSLAAAMAKDPAERTEFFQDLKNAIAHRPLLAQATSSGREIADNLNP